MTASHVTSRKDAYHRQQARPEPLPVEAANVPAELQTLPQWVGWDHRRVRDKWTKVPLNPTNGRKAATNAPNTWGTFDDALAFYQRTGCAGIGFVFTAADPFAGIDLDDCLDPETGVIKPWADAIIKRIASYTEVSPSGTGVKIFCRASLARSLKRGNIEMYDRGRYFTVTGRRVESFPVAEPHEPLDALAPEPPPAPTPTAPTSTAARPAYTASHEDDSRRKAVEALQHLSPSRCVDYQSWLNVGMALHSVADDLLDDWESWSRGCPEKYSAEECARKWRGFSRDGKITLGSLLHWAKQDTGWRPQRRVPHPPTPQISENAMIAPALPTLTTHLHAAAYTGLAGQFVRLVEPHSEADPAALLIQFLAAFGTCIGRRAHFIVESSTHYLALFVALVGLSGKGRKGTSWDHVDRLFAAIEPNWDAICCSGLSSAEGLLWHLRDDGNDNPDKRLICCESEFAAVLNVMARQGNNLSPLLRQLWDCKRVVRTLTKKDPVKATGAHVALVAHITEAELKKCLSETDQANGFGNRFLWVAARRSKLLPEGGQLCPDALRDLREELRPALAFAQDQQTIGFDAPARDEWHRVYGQLSEGRPGLAGSLLARAEAQVRRLACLYALLDVSPVVRTAHLDAALAVWRYAEESVRHVFGHSLGNPIADQLLAALDAAPAGLTRTDMHNGLFGRHVSAEQLDTALTLLQSLGLAHGVRSTTAGRPEERWFAGLRPANEANKAEQAASPSTLSPLCSLPSQPAASPERPSGTGSYAQPSPSPPA